MGTRSSSERVEDAAGSADAAAQDNIALFLA